MAIFNYFKLFRRYSVNVFSTRFLEKDLNEYVFNSMISLSHIYSSVLPEENLQYSYLLSIYFSFMKHNIEFFFCDRQVQILIFLSSGCISF